MTSFDFSTSPCAVCHPGGGPLEYDRNGNRYDEYASDPANGITSGGDNGLDGDYYKATWAESGVAEADCLICHLPTYDKKARDGQILGQNLQWAATVGASLGTVTGSVKAGDTPTLTYDVAAFNPDGTVPLALSVQPTTAACLTCHGETDWKKKGASFSSRTDVHMRAGMRCVDCHRAGSGAQDPRINGWEMHQIGKGDDPGTLVRDDLDNTMLSCRECHEQRELGAPAPHHEALPTDHLTKIACQTCHIPTRHVKAAHIQDSSVWNTGPFIPTGKRIWSFYGDDLKPWNFYGEKARFTYANQPRFDYRPLLGWYGGQIFPLNKVYTIWVGIEEDGRPGLDMPTMKDFGGMWRAHLADPNAYPQLSEIADDNADGYLDINRPEEVGAIIAATTAMLSDKGVPLEGKRVVFVKGAKLYRSGSQSEDIPAEPYEFTPYGATFKYSHDVAPAKAALGAGGCSDCHSPKSDFLYRETLVDPFDEAARPAMVPQYEALGMTRSRARQLARLKTTP